MTEWPAVHIIRLYSSFGIYERNTTKGKLNSNPKNPNLLHKHEKFYYYIAIGVSSFFFFFF